MAKGYFAGNYFKEDFWNDNYWAPTGTSVPSGSYWNPNYWNQPGHWNVNYWKVVNTGGVTQNDPATFPITGFNPSISIGLTVEATTTTFPVSTFAADANLDIDPAVTAATFPITPFNANVGLEGYQLGDIDFRFIPDSVFTVTFGVVATSPTFPMFGMANTVDAGNINVGASLITFPMSTLQAGARLDVAVEPLPATFPISDFDTTAGIGIQVSTNLVTMPFVTGTHTVVATDTDANVNAKATAFPVQVFDALVHAVEPPQVPEPTFKVDNIVNLFATEGPTNYEICDITGFRVKPGELKEQWDGLKVREESWSQRHPQDFVRSRAEKLEGSERPEQDDQFVEDRYPNGVSANDL